MMLKNVNFAVQKLMKMYAAEETKVINTDEIENAYQEHQAELNENLVITK